MVKNKHKAKNKDNIRSFKAYKRRKKNKNKLGKIKVISMIAFLATIAVLNLCVYQIAASLKYEIYYLKKDLNKKLIRLENIEVDEACNYNLKKIEKEATDKLDMIYPTESQIRYIGGAYEKDKDKK